MSGKKVGVFGIYSTRVGVENAVDALVRAGFPSPDISVLFQSVRNKEAEHMTAIVEWANQRKWTTTQVENTIYAENI